MFTSEQRRFMQAQQKVRSFLTAPIEEFLSSTNALILFYKQRADEAWQAGYAAGKAGLPELSND